ncbi:aldehyde ferredoxin oxidoreductase family protein [Chloroflexota bacterium]
MSLNRKLIHIDLSTKKITSKPIPQDIRYQFLGGRGINMLLLYRLTSPSTDALGKDNTLIFGAGLLAGIPGFGTRLNISAKSPESGYLGDSNMGGDFAAELAYAGFSHLVIQGESASPVYLWIKDGHIEIKDASHLWGLDTVETQLAIRKELDDDNIKIACIGPAGENLVRFATVRTGLKNAAGRTGMGTVMGTKRLKGVAVRGTLGVSLAEPKEYLKAYQKQLSNLMQRKWVQALGRYGTPLLIRYSNAMGFLSVRNHQAVTLGVDGEKLSPTNLERYSTGMMGCFSCPTHCRHRYHLKSLRYPETRGEGPEYASIASLGANLGNVDLENVIYSIELCNRYGLDTISTGAYIGIAIELYQRGIIGEETTGVPLHWGDGETILRLIHMIAHCEGFGAVLASGYSGLCGLAKDAADYVFTIKNMPLELTDERAVKSFAFGIATATRGCDHMRSRPSLDVTNLPKEILDKLYAADMDTDFTSYKGKARMVWWHELLNAVCDSIGFCRFMTVFSSAQALQYPEFSELVGLATGMKLSSEELMKIGERICTLERQYLVRLGLTRKDDTLPSRYLDEPVPHGPSEGEFFRRDQLESMLDEYYQLHGWETDSIPSAETLRRLDLDNPSEVLL